MQRDLPVYHATSPYGASAKFFISWDRGLKDIVWMIYDQGKESIIDHPHYVF